VFSAVYEIALDRLRRQMLYPPELWAQKRTGHHHSNARMQPQERTSAWKRRDPDFDPDISTP
jgi:hypothetical protein